MLSYTPDAFSGYGLILQCCSIFSFCPQCIPCDSWPAVLQHVKYWVQYAYQKILKYWSRQLHTPVHKEFLMPTYTLLWKRSQKWQQKHFQINKHISVTCTYYFRTTCTSMSMYILHMQEARANKCNHNNMFYVITVCACQQFSDDFKNKI